MSITAVQERTLVQELVDGLEVAQQALAMLISPEAIAVTSSLTAFAAVTEAEAKARATIAKGRAALDVAADQTPTIKWEAEKP